LQRMVLAGLLVVLLGFGLIVVGSADQAGTSTGGVVFIGPFPITFGFGPNGSSLALMSVVIGAIIVVLVMLWGWRFFRMRSREVE